MADEDETEPVAVAALIAVFCELSDVETELVADDDEPDPSLIFPHPIEEPICNRATHT